MQLAESSVWGLVGQPQLGPWSQLRLGATFQALVVTRIQFLVIERLGSLFPVACQLEIVLSF